MAISGFSLLSSPDVTLKACAVGVDWNRHRGLRQRRHNHDRHFPANSTLFIDSAAAPATPNSRLHLQATVSGLGLLSGTLTAVISAQVSSLSPRDLVAVTTNS